jgi:putative ABC transport system permease protein
VRNTFRNAIRTVGIIVILTVAIALSISMLIARDAVNNKIDSVRASTGTAVTISPAGFFGFEGNGTPLTASQLTTVAALAHVTKVTSSLTQVLTSSQTSLTAPSPAGGLGRQFGGGGFSGGSGGGFTGGTFTPPIRVVGTNSPGTALVGGANNGGTETLKAGHAYGASSSADVAVVGTSLAAKNKLAVGDTFTAWGTTIKVVGLYDAGSTFANSEILMPLATVQTLSGDAGDVSNATAYVDTVANVASVDKAIKSALGTSVDVTSEQQLAEQQLSGLNSVSTISTYTLVGTVIGAGLILLLSMLMIVRERRREIGVLKALGASNRSVVTQFIAESATFTVLGSAVGFLVGVLISSPITSALVNANSSSNSGGFPSGGFFHRQAGNIPGGGLRFSGHSFASTFTQVHAAAGWSTLVFAFVIALLVAVIGSSVAAATVVRVRPAEVLRSE